MRKLKIVALTFLAVLVILSVFIRIRYGGGEYYPNLSTEPLFPEDSLEIVFTYDQAFGNLAVSKDNRIFFTVHPESRPEGDKLLEIVNGKAKAFPNEAFQDQFITVLGTFIDKNNVLWTIDHGNHGLQTVRLLAFDLSTNELVHDHTFSPEIAGIGSFYNDLQVSKEGMVYIADLNLFGKNPAVVVYNSKTGESRRLLENDASVYPQDWIIRNNNMDVTFFWGLFALKPGIDGLVLSANENYLFYGAMAHDGLFRIKTEYLNNTSLLPKELSRFVEQVGPKPLNDGLSIDTLNNVYITDVEHNGIMRLSPDGKLITLIKSNKIRWADGASFGGDGYLYFTDSALPDQMLRSKSHMKSAAPYHILRFNPKVAGIPGR
ncbi:MAG TPA: L-dopachrome tautomerase-related protein [Fulvivirga sp.]|nr:L-dopachrome tautomerase-related protein [Fulvivirga sp.]